MTGIKVEPIDSSRDQVAWLRFRRVLIRSPPWARLWPEKFREGNLNQPELSALQGLYEFNAHTVARTGFVHGCYYKVAALAEPLKMRTVS